MKCRLAHVAGGLFLTLACGARVEIGQGGTAGAGGNMVGAGTAGSVASSAGENDGATAGTTSGGTASTGGPIPKDDGPQAEVGKVDLLLAVDNSLSMATKQQLLAKAIPELVKRLVNPYCVSSAGAVVVVDSASPEQACPAGSEREFAPLRDLHVGVITSSLGSHGASSPKDVCVAAEDDDHAYLLPFVRGDLPSYDGKGFLKWDPDRLATPPGESDVQAFADSLETIIASAGEHGCGYEAQLESVYRFLVDPEPAASLSLQGQQSQKVGIDKELLRQRAQFLRPDSSVVVLMLTDENDCSIQDEGYGYLIARAAPMFRSTSECLTNPNDECCQSCGESVALPGCGVLADDPECQKGALLEQDEDDLNLRCFNHKGRFGFDLLYPVARYVSGFGAGTVPNRAGELVENPLFHQNGQQRDRSLFTLAVIGGVPWQDLATPESLGGENLQYMTPEQLDSSNRWPVLLGYANANQPPLDPFMRESIEPRVGENPIIGVSTVPTTSTDPTANPINGHEHETIHRDLQYACTFELPEPIVCDQQADEEGRGCACFEYDVPFNRSVCNPPQGGPATTTQYRGAAYPSVRPLAVARELGRRSVLGSVCARNTRDETRADYGYRPLFSALGQRIARTLVKP